MKTASIVLCIAEFIRYCLLGGYFDLNYILFPNLNLVLLLHKTFLNTYVTQLHAIIISYSHVTITYTFYYILRKAIFTDIILSHVLVYVLAPLYESNVL